MDLCAHSLQSSTQVSSIVMAHGKSPEADVIYIQQARHRQELIPTLPTAIVRTNGLGYAREMSTLRDA